MSLLNVQTVPLAENTTLQHVHLLIFFSESQKEWLKQYFLLYLMSFFVITWAANLRSSFAMAWQEKVLVRVLNSAKGGKSCMRWETPYILRMKIGSELINSEDFFLGGRGTEFPSTLQGTIIFFLFLLFLNLHLSRSFQWEYNFSFRSRMFFVVLYVIWLFKITH